MTDASDTGASWKARLALAGATLVACLAAAEVALRVRAHFENRNTADAAFAADYPVPAEGRVGLVHIIRPSPDDRIIYELKPGIEPTVFKGGELSTNAAGFRGPELPPTAPDVATIVGIGDSLMFGHGVSDGEPFLRVLDDALAEKYPHVTWRVVNTGVPGYNTVMEVQTLREKCLALEPDIVIWSLVGNDLELPAFVRSEEDVLAVDKSFLVAFVREALASSKRETHPLLSRAPLSVGENKVTFEGDPEKVPERYRDTVGWEAFARAADELVELSREHDFRLLAFADYEDAIILRMLEEATAREVPTLSLMPDLLRYMEEIGNTHYKFTDLAVSPNNVHPSAKHHRMAGEKLLAELERLGWIEALVDARGGPARER